MGVGVWAWVQCCSLWVYCAVLPPYFDPLLPNGTYHLELGDAGHRQVGVGVGTAVWAWAWAWACGCGRGRVSEGMGVGIGMAWAWAWAWTWAWVYCAVLQQLCLLTPKG